MPKGNDGTRIEGKRLTRRDLLKKAGVGAAALGVSGAAAPFSFAGPMRYKGRWLKGDLSIIQWVHFVPAYDDWFDNTWVKQWGQKNDVQVKVEHINNTLLDTRAAAEVAAQNGHDLFMAIHPMAQYEDQVINHAPIIQEIEHKVGKYGDIGRLSTYNPKTKKYFAVSDCYVPDPVIWRHDLWNGIGEAPFTWDHVRKAAPKLKALGHPIGIGQSQELDSNMALIAFLMCFGSFIQNSSNRPTLNSKNTVEAVKFMVDLYKTGEDSAIFAWNPASSSTCFACRAISCRSALRRSGAIESWAGRVMLTSSSGVAGQCGKPSIIRIPSKSRTPRSLRWRSKTCSIPRSRRRSAHRSGSL